MAVPATWKFRIKLQFDSQETGDRHAMHVLPHGTIGNSGKYAGGDDNFDSRSSNLFQNESHFIDSVLLMLD